MVIPENVLYALDTLNKNGYEAYLVGGCVRDMIMGNEPSDFDITTNALPDEIVKCFSDKKCVLSGMKHGTVAPIIDYEVIEITTYRIDGEYKDSRHPESVYFTKRTEDDLSRRDFTVNAMAMDKDFNIIDPFSGREDIKNKIIRCVGNPEKRFSEDALRIMRALRFSSTLSFRIDESTKEGILKLYTLLSNIARERIFAELKKLLKGPDAGKILAEYRDVFIHIMPKLSAVGEDRYYKNASCIDCDDTAVAFALLFDGLEGSDAGAVLTSLKSDGALKRTVVNLIEDKNSDISDEISLSRYLKKREAEDAERLIMYRYALNEITKADREKLFSLLEKVKASCVRIKDLDITGSDLIKLGFSGSKIGDALEMLLDAVIEGFCENEKNTLIDYAKKLCK